MNTHFLSQIIRATCFFLIAIYGICMCVLWMGTANEGDVIAYIGPKPNTGWFENHMAVNVYDVRTKVTASLTTLELYPHLFSWSPNGEFIGMIARSYGNVNNQIGLYVMESDGNNLRLISDNLSVVIASERPPFWSSDNQNLVFQATQGGGNVVQFYKGYLDGTLPELIDLSHPLAQAYIQNFFPTYQTAPNGLYRVLVDYRNKEWGLYVVIGEKQQKVYHLTAETIMPDAADWSPDSRLIAFSQRKKQIPMINVITMTGDIVFEIEQGRYPLWKP